MSTRNQLDTLAVGFNAKTGYSPTKGDLVSMSDAWEIELPSAAGEFYIGTVDVVDNGKATKVVTVATRFRRKCTVTAASAITAPAWIMQAGSNKVAAADIISTPTNLWNQVVGLALEDAAGDGSTLEALLF